MSRPRSARPASGAAGGRPAARPGVFVQTPKSDIYVALLGISLGAMLLGCILLALVLSRYDFSIKVSRRAESTAAEALALAINSNANTVNFYTEHL